MIGVVKAGAVEVESQELGSHHSTIGFEGVRRDSLRCSRVSIASGFSPMTFGKKRAAGLVLRIVEWFGVVKVRNASGTERRVEIGAA